MPSRVKSTAHQDGQARRRPSQRGRSTAFQPLFKAYRAAVSKRLAETPKPPERISWPKPRVTRQTPQGGPQHPQDHADDGTDRHRPLQEGDGPRQSRPRPTRARSRELAADLSASAGNVKHPLLEKREHGQEQPAAGAVLQSRPVRRLQRHHSPRGQRAHPARCRRESISCIWTLGQAGDRCSSAIQGITAEQTFTRISRTSRRFDEVEVLADRYIADYIAGQIDRVEVAYMKFFNAARQTAGRRNAAAALDAPSRRQPAGRPRRRNGRIRIPAGRRRTSWKRLCRCRSRCGCSSASSTRP